MIHDPALKPHRMNVDVDELPTRAARAGAFLPLATLLRLCAQIYGNDEVARLAKGLGPVPWDGLQRRLITTSMVLAAKGANRWRLLPQRYVCRRLLRAREPLIAKRGN
jgi:hypothetical protein